MLINISTSRYLTIVRPACYLLFDIAGKMLTLSADPLHHFFTIYLYSGCYAKLSRMLGIMSAVSSCDKQLTWHTTDGNTGGCPKAIVNNNHIFYVFFRLAKSVLTSSPSSNDRNGYLACYVLRSAVLRSTVIRGVRDSIRLFIHSILK